MKTKGTLTCFPVIILLLQTAVVTGAVLSLVGCASTMRLDPISYNPGKLSPWAAASECIAVLNAHGYGASIDRGRTMTFGEGGKVSVAPSTKDEFIFVTTDFQKPTSGSQSKEWRYNATVSAITNYYVVDLKVEVKSPGDILGVPVDTAVTFWTPPDMKEIYEELRSRLQIYGTK